MAFLHHSRALPEVEITPETFQHPSTMWPRHSRRLSRTGSLEQRLIPSEVPERTQARPGKTVAVPSSETMKSGPAATTGVPAGMPLAAAPAALTVPSIFPEGMNGGNFAGSIPREQIRAGSQM